MFKILMLILALLPQVDEPKPVTGPIGDTLAAIKSLRKDTQSNAGILDLLVRNVEASKGAIGERIGGIGDRLKTNETKLGGILGRLDRVDSDRKSFLQEWRADRMAASKQRQEFRIEQKQIRAEIAKQKGETVFWRFCSIATLAISGVAVFLLVKLG